MTVEDMQQRISELEKERDSWRDMASQLMRYLPAPAPVVLPTPPQPIWPYAPPTYPIITW